uniref:PAXIP1-associated protein 1 n=1 Tax=Anopheles farauti TaxID=69004 RepID=A0A182Q6R5_9DIPT
MSEDENWSVNSIETSDWMPSPEELENAYSALEKGTYTLELNWKCPGRRAPSPLKKDEPKVAEVIDKEAAAKNKEFDFMDDVAKPAMRVRGQTTGPKGSAKKKTTNFAGVLDHMKKHGRLTQSKDSSGS